MEFQARGGQYKSSRQAQLRTTIVASSHDFVTTTVATGRSVLWRMPMDLCAGPFQLFEEAMTSKQLVALAEISPKTERSDCRGGK